MVRFVVLAGLVFSGNVAFGCMCFSPEPLCNDPPGAGRERLVVIGRVVGLRADRRVMRARIAVSEWLQGNGGRYAEVLTDRSSCGIRFGVGKEYLVVAFAEDGSRWRTFACSGTRPVAQAVEDIEAARAWRSGSPVPRRVYGTLEGIAGREGVPIALWQGTAALRVVTDSGGRYMFDELEAAEYVLRPDVAGWTGAPERVDLRTDRCHAGWIAHSPTLPDPPEVRTAMPGLPAEMLSPGAPGRGRP
jgi:hypothetical protein